MDGRTVLPHPRRLASELLSASIHVAEARRRLERARRQLCPGGDTRDPAYLARLAAATGHLVEIIEGLRQRQNPRLLPAESLASAPRLLPIRVK